MPLNRRILKSKRFALAQSLIRSYVESRDGLKKLDILRSERSLQADYAEWVVAELLGLKPARSKTQKGFDAKDSKGRTYQIKSRIVSEVMKPTSFDIIDVRDPFGFLIGVFFSPTIEILKIIRVPYSVVIEMARVNERNARFRWNRRTMQDPRVETLLEVGAV